MSEQRMGGPVSLDEDVEERIANYLKVAPDRTRSDVVNMLCRRALKGAEIEKDSC
jgi:hypothetical protein